MDCRISAKFSKCEHLWFSLLNWR